MVGGSARITGFRFQSRFLGSISIIGLLGRYGDRVLPHAQVWHPAFIFEELILGKGDREKYETGEASHSFNFKLFNIPGLLAKLFAMILAPASVNFVSDCAPLASPQLGFQRTSISVESAWSPPPVIGPPGLYSLGTLVAALNERPKLVECLRRIGVVRETRPAGSLELIAFPRQIRGCP